MVELTVRKVDQIVLEAMAAKLGMDVNDVMSLAVRRLDTDVRSELSGDTTEWSRQYY